MTPKLLLVDGFSLAFRAYYSFPPTLTLPDGTPIHMVLGFITLLLKGIESLEPSHVCVCFDLPEPTFRHVEFEAYKAHRPPAPDDFKIQVPLLKALLRDLDIACEELGGYEADDLIGTLSLLMEQSGGSSVIMTADQDALQLVSESTVVAMNKKGASDLMIFDPAKVKEVYGLTPSQIIDLKALQGDTSDNIPGVKGIGNKIATSLLETYTSLAGIYDHLAEIPSKSVREKLSENKDMAFLSYRLVTVLRDVPLVFDLDRYFHREHLSSWIEAFKAYHFRALVAKYEKKSGTLQETLPVTAFRDSVAIDYRCISTVVELEGLCDRLKTGFAIDLETTSLSPVEAQIVGVSLSNESGYAWYIPLNDFLETVSSDSGLALFDACYTPLQFRLNPFLACLKPLLEDASIPKITHHGKYEWQVLKNYDIALRGVSFDTMLAAFLVFPGEKVGLKDLALRHLNVEMKHYDEVVAKGATFDSVSLDLATSYAAADADMTWRLKGLLASLIESKGLSFLLYDIELPTQWVLAAMEYSGICLDCDFLRGLDREFREKSDVLQSQIMALSGRSFNLNSPKQLGDVLYDELQLPVLKKTKTGRSTDSSVLEKLAETYEIARYIMTYRGLEKLLSTYVTALPALVSPQTGRVHTSFNQTVAITGRLSSTNPNLQNIPIRTEEGQKIRRAFLPLSSDHCILSVDYSQIELRIMAHLSGDDTMTAAFKNGEDIHVSTAAVVNHIPISEVTKEQRYHAKAVNFGIIYGISDYGLSENLGISREEAKGIITTYFAQFSKIKAFMDATISATREKGFVTTEFGRIRPVPEIDSRIFHRRQFAERTAVNTRVQGTAADLMKLAMIRVQEALKVSQLDAVLLIQVHDELVLSVSQRDLPRVAFLVKTAMMSVVDWDIPLEVDLEYGPNWMALSPYILES